MKQLLRRFSHLLRCRPHACHHVEWELIDADTRAPAPLHQFCITPFKCITCWLWECYTPITRLTLSHNLVVFSPLLRFVSVNALRCSFISRDVQRDIVDVIGPSNSVSRATLRYSRLSIRLDGRWFLWMQTKGKFLIALWPITQVFDI